MKKPKPLIEDRVPKIRESRTEAAHARRYIHRVRKDPVWFAENVLRLKTLPGEPTLAENPARSWQLDKFQAEILQAVADVWRKKNGLATVINHEGTPFITVRSGHGPGKTFTAAVVAHWFNAAFRGRVVCTAPKLAQLRTRLWSAIRKVDSRAEAYYRTTHEIHDTAVYWYRPDDTGKLVEDRDWCILAETARQPENLAGHHERFQLVIVEEASGVPESLWPVVFGALSAGEIQILLMISNPSRVSGTFGSSHLQAKEATNYFRYHINLANSRRIDRTWVEAMERKYGKDSPVVAVRCHGEFPTNDPCQLIAYEWVSRALDSEAPKPDGSLATLRVSVDVADGGEDETVITVARHYQSFIMVLHQSVHSFPAAVSPIMAADKAEALFKSFGGDPEADDFVVDSLGVGAGTAGTLMQRDYRVVRYVGGGASADPARWRNRRVQSYIAMRDALRDGRLAFADDFAESPEDRDDLTAQICSVKTKAEQFRVEDIVTKEQMKADGIKSPDRADSLAMQFATQRPQLIPRSRDDAPSPSVPVVSPLTVLDGYIG